MSFLEAGIGFELLLLEMSKALFLIGLPLLTLVFFLVSVGKTNSHDISTCGGLKMLWLGLLKALVLVLVSFAVIMVLSVCTFRDGDV